MPLVEDCQAPEGRIPSGELGEGNELSSKKVALSLSAEAVARVM